MRAIIIKQTGSSEQLKLSQQPKPDISDAHEVRVKLCAAGINPIDTKLRSNGLYFAEQYPAILGCDGAGVIDAVGDAVEGFAVGDEVFYCYGGLGKRSGQHSLGNYAEYNLVDYRFLAHKANSVAFDEAAAAPLVCITAWEALFDRAALRGGEQVFIAGGCGGVGHVAIQMAKIAGCKVATTVSNDEKAAFAKQLGADCIINYQQEDLQQAVMAWTNNQGVDIALDTIGGDFCASLPPIMGLYSDLVTLLQIPDTIDWKALRLNNVRISQELMLTPMVKGLHELGLHHAEILEQCAQWMDERKLHIHVQQSFPLQEAHKAHQLLEQGHTSGKLVLEIDS